MWGSIKKENSNDLESSLLAIALHRFGCNSICIPSFFSSLKENAPKSEFENNLLHTVLSNTVPLTGLRSYLWQNTTLKTEIIFFCNSSTHWDILCHKSAKDQLN